MNQPFGNYGFPSFLFCAVSLQVLRTGGLISNHWKLDDGKVVRASDSDAVASSSCPPLCEIPATDGEAEGDDLFFDIVTSTNFKGGSWRRTAFDDAQDSGSVCRECRVEDLSFGARETIPVGPPVTNTRTGERTSSSVVSAQPVKQQASPHPHQKPDELDCGKPVNFTYYDHLPGVSQRHTHPTIIEPHLALVFHEGASGGSGNFKIKRNIVVSDLEAMEKALKKAKKEKPRTEQLYNQLGNYWRIRGDSLRTIECFRKALTIAPNSAEVLINLARVLLNLQYKEDALFLAKRSLEVHPPHLNPWLIHFTLGEIFKEFGHYQEAALHLRHCLDLKPSWTPAADVLREMGDPFMPFDMDPASRTSYVHIYTLLIIVFLCLGVLLGILSSVDGILANDDNDGSGKGMRGEAGGSASSGFGKRHHGHHVAVKGKWRRP